MRITLWNIGGISRSSIGASNTTINKLAAQVSVQFMQYFFNLKEVLYSIIILISHLLSLIVSPRLSTKPSDRTVVENEEVTFTCAATGNPDPKITWIKNGKTVGLGNKLSFVTDRNHSGEYWCTADNGVDEAVNASAFLEVQCKYGQWQV